MWLVVVSEQIGDRYYTYEDLELAMSWIKHNMEVGRKVTIVMTHHIVK